MKESTTLSSRKIVQIAPATGFLLVALCDDGTLWGLNYLTGKYTWGRIDGIPK